MTQIRTKPSQRWTEFLNRPQDPIRNLKRDLEKSGNKIIDMRPGDPALFGLVNEDLSSALLEVAKVNCNMYPEYSGWVDRLKEAISGFERRERGVDVIPENMVIGQGIAGLFRDINFALLDQGDEMIAFNPSHFFTLPTSYWSYLGARLVSAPTHVSQDFSPDLDGLRERIVEKTKALVVNSPNNPLGTVYSDKTLREIVNIAGEHDLLVISDEIYGLVTFDGVQATPLARIAGDVPILVVSGMSKVFVAPGWRIGYAYAHDPRGRLDDVMNAIRRIGNAYGFSIRSLATPILAAATLVYEKCLEPRKRVIAELQKRRDFACRRLNEIAGIECTRPQGALYAFPKVEAIGEKWKTDLDFMLDLMRKEYVVFSPGSSFGDLGKGHFRTIILPDIPLQEEVFMRLERFIGR